MRDGIEHAGALFSTGLADRVGTAAMPVLLALGMPLLPPRAQMLAYDVQP